MAAAYARLANRSVLVVLFPSSARQPLLLTVAGNEIASGAMPDGSGHNPWQGRTIRATLHLRIVAVLGTIPEC